MKALSILILLSLTLLTATAGDAPRRITVDGELIAILKVAREYRSEGTTTMQVERDPARDSAYVRYCVHQNGQDVVMSVVVLKKTARGWRAESCAR